MGMQGVGNGKAASPKSGGGSNQPRSVATAKTPVARNGSSVNDQSRPVGTTAVPVARPAHKGNMAESVRSGSLMAKPSGQGGTDQRNGLVAKPTTDSGTNQKEGAASKVTPGVRSGKTYDPRDSLPDPSTVLPGNLGRAN